jgi:HK97 family phage major capsid protein
MKTQKLLFAAAIAVAVIGAIALYAGASWMDVGAAGVVLCNAPGAIEVEKVKEAIAEASKAVKATTDRMQQALDAAINDVKKLETITGKTNDELNKATAASTKTQNELKAALDRLLEVEQKIAQRHAGADPQARKSWGASVTESDAYKAAKERESKGGKPEMDTVQVGSWHKTVTTDAVMTSAGTVGYLTPAELAPFVGGQPRQLVVRSLIPVYQTESNLINFASENVFTNAAAPQGGLSSPSAQSESQLKAQSELTFKFTQVPVVTIAHWIPASRQVLADAKMLGSYIDQRLRYGVLFEEEREVLLSTGTNGELNGLINQATAFNRTNTADQELDQLLEAMLQVTLSEYSADGVVLSYVDWTALLKLKDTQGRYIFGDPTSANPNPRVWGRPVVPTNSLTSRKFLVGAFQLATALWDREEATVRIAEQHSDFFVRNLVVLLAEERVALTVYRPAALVTGTFHQGSQPG